MCAPASIWGLISITAVFSLSVLIPSFSPFYIFLSAVFLMETFPSFTAPSVCTSIFKAVIWSGVAVFAGVRMTMLLFRASC